ncbi:MAG: VWA domain-containing protein [Oscillospiraceae bacterium]|nr:VWA domain-containing protein [Oscillospiraceae bacterium]
MNKNKNDITELVFILDASGSMHDLTDDTIGGFNAMIEKQKQEDGACYVSTVSFHTESTVLHDRVPLGKVAPLTRDDYRAQGCTALLDAVGDAVRHIANIHKYARPEDVPAHTMFVITTDGMENASHRYTYDQIKSLIEEKKAKGWEFLFVAANIDAAATAARVGISAERTANYRSDEAGTRLLYEALAAPISAARGGRTIDRAWAEALEEDNAVRSRHPRGKK